MAADLPTPPKSPMAEMRPAPAKAGDRVYRKGELADQQADQQRSLSLQRQFEQQETQRRAVRSARSVDGDGESVGRKLVRGYRTLTGRR